ncbi:MAG TPA: MaoC/PaaZ C-terminal domain-containing protein [Steroidobacteraceae bacterium]|nr:MaoC/PaaZ C-terminal domain-containing protein [Steroidobacteraceae bacterium]HQX79559.1 MaoC/PaaZ C-terminal domain-containing protein [Steroidobacteraceae bacterium]
MTLDYQRLRSWPFGVIEHAYTEKDTILYALGVGLGMDPLDERQLRFVCEENLVAMPTQAVVLGFPGFWAKHPDSTIDWVRLLLGAHSLRIHRPLQPRGVVIAHNAVTRVIDKGAGKGALVVTERQLLEKGSGELLATLEQLSFCRGDGGYSMPGAAHPAGQPSDPPLPDPPAVPDGAPDLICDLATRPEAALLYRLSGDLNPLHADPQIAAAAGFPRPILHGLATYGVACHAILRSCCDYRPERLTALSARFASPVYPGETIRTEIWHREGHALFRARVVERDVVVLGSGRAEFT